MRKAMSGALNHVKCRGSSYPGGPKRFPVPDDRVRWNDDFPEYKPIRYTAAPVAANPVWADPDISGDAKFDFNKIDGKIDRRSFSGIYEIVSGMPRNPVGRTGIVERGLLGKWGPNHAADPIVTRWKRDCSGAIVQKEGKGVLEFVSIQRKDTGEWAIPGGMVDAGEDVSLTLKREFSEEALSALDLPEDKKRAVESKLGELFHHGDKIYEGYVDDPRNTDNAWMETVAVNFHDETGETFGQFSLKAGDDAKDVCWKEISCELRLYASHLDFIQRVAKLRNAHF